MDSKINFFLGIFIVIATLGNFFLATTALRQYNPESLKHDNLPANFTVLGTQQISGGELRFAAVDFQEIVPETTWRNWVTFFPKPVKNPRSPAPTFLDLWTNQTKPDNLEGLALDEAALGEYILGLEATLNREPQDAKMRIENGRATEFVPHLEGLALDLATTRNLIATGLPPKESASEIALPVRSFSPQILLADLNTLGIKELVARGQSDFSGSSSSRIKNISVGAERFRGLLIKPGEEFSFNKYLGPVDGAHGFVPELVIKPEGTMPEFGGGLCQVSSTAFRAAFFGGLPILERRNHSYAVKYYEWISDDRPRAVGLDATIYPGAQDLKFRNDTPATILVWTYIEGKRLYFDFYGTTDHRIVAVDGPHPYDRKTDGSVKSTVTRMVSFTSGEIEEKTFNSAYVSPDKYPRVYEYPPPLESPTSTPITN